MFITQEQIHQVIQLAQAVQVADDVFHNKYFPNKVIRLEEYEAHMNTPEFLRLDEAKQKLRHYLSQLDYMAILDLEGVMQYGRELASYDGLDGLRRLIGNGQSDRSDLLDAKGSFASARSHFATTYPSPDGKMLAIDFLMGKMDLYKYLRYAADALGITGEQDHTGFVF